MPCGAPIARTSLLKPRLLIEGEYVWTGHAKFLSMVKKCCIPGCKSNYDKRRKKRDHAVDEENKENEHPNGAFLHLIISLI